MTKLICMRSCPAGGKTTWVNRYLLTNPGAVAVSRDAIRFSLYGVYFGYPIDEDYVTKVQDATVVAALRDGKDCIIDDCNVKQHYINHWAYVAWEYDAEFVLQQIDVELGVALERNKGRDRQVPDDVIGLFHADLQKKVEVPKFHKVVPYDALLGMPDAWLIDIDGTIAHKGDRGYYDWDKVDVDTVNWAVARFALAVKYIGDEVVFLSGRDESCRDLTEIWLAEHIGITDFKLFMRKAKDMRKDTIVKYELFDKYIRNHYNVKGVLDDRATVCRQWRKMGLTVLQLGDPHVEF